MLPSSKSFYHLDKGILSLASIDFIDQTIVETTLNEFDLTPKNNHQWYWFVRLNVHQKLRGQGIGNKLMKELCEWADQEHVNIMNAVNAYGDLNSSQLISFYEKFGFVHIGENMMIREIGTNG